MHLIKLSATPSTNDFLKQLSATTSLEDFTVVWADIQTNGKGQMGSVWVSEDAKNLTFSIFLKQNTISINDLFLLNIIVANAVIKALDTLNLTNIYIKWPNDILSYNKKIGGILIENNIGVNSNVTSIIGIGLNINQTNFDKFPQASSIFKQYQIAIDFEDLLVKIVDNIKYGVENLNECREDEWAFYHTKLFRKDVVSTFEDKKGGKFNGIIKKVNRYGQLEVLLDHNDLKCFNLKDVKLMY